MGVWDFDVACGIVRDTVALCGPTLRKVDRALVMFSGTSWNLTLIPRLHAGLCSMSSPKHTGGWELNP